MDRVTASASDATGQFLASGHTSLMHGWVPTTGLQEVSRPNNTWEDPVHNVDQMAGKRSA